MRELYSSYSMSGFMKKISKQNRSKFMLFYTIILFTNSYETSILL